MSIDLVNLGKRIRQARENCGITQQQAAEAIGVPRTAIVHMEAGHRVPSTLELSDFANLYKRPITEFFGSEPVLVEGSDQVDLHLRVEQAFRDNPEVKSHIDKWLEIVREGAELEQLLGAPQRDGLPYYAQPQPKSLSEAFEQGEFVGQQERNRLALGNNPIHMLPDLLSTEGVWVASVNLPNEISGMFLHEAAIGPVIIVNNTHPRVRRRFSYAHEYAHALLDRTRDATALVSTRQNATERTEKRANAFAATFLMPGAGVRSFLTSLDKGALIRSVHAVWGITGSDEAEQRLPAGSQKIVYQDVALLARYFGASYQAAACRLRDLNLIGVAELKALLEQVNLANRYLHVLNFLQSIDSDEPPAHPEPEETRELVSQVVYRAIEAYRREEISKGRLRDLSSKLGIPGKQLLELAEAAL